MNQSRIADIDRYDTGLQVANATLIQSSPALRNCRMLIVAMAKYLLVELYGEVASLCSQISNYIHLGRLDCMRNGAWEETLTTLVVPSRCPAAGAKGLVGQHELYPSVYRSVSHSASAGSRTWRQGAKSSPLAMMHLW